MIVKIRSKLVDKFLGNSYISQDNIVVGKLTYPTFDYKGLYIDRSIGIGGRVDRTLSSCWSGQKDTAWD